MPITDFQDPEGAETEVDDNKAEEAAFNQRAKGKFVFPPSGEVAELALMDITAILKPPRKSSRGHKKCTLDSITRHRLEGIRMFLLAYVRKEKSQLNQRGNWSSASRRLQLYAPQRRPRRGNTTLRSSGHGCTHLLMTEMSCRRITGGTVVNQQLTTMILHRTSTFTFSVSSDR